MRKMTIRAERISGHTPTDASAINPGYATYLPVIEGDVPAGFSPRLDQYGGSNFHHNLAARVGFFATHEITPRGLLPLQGMTPVNDRRPFDTEAVFVDGEGKVWRATAANHYDPARATEIEFEAQTVHHLEKP